MPNGCNLKYLCHTVVNQHAWLLEYAQVYGLNCFPVVVGSQFQASIMSNIISVGE